jgi:hypothetical protein
VPLVIFSHPHVGSIAFHFVVPGVHGGVSSNAVLLIIAIVGTTVAPWQLFFQQSNVIDKRITPRFIRYERADTILGSLVVVVSAAVILIATVYAVAGTSRAGHFMDALGVANAFGAKSSFLGAVFALVLLDASIIGAAAVTLSTSYAFGDVFNLTHSLHPQIPRRQGLLRQLHAGRRARGGHCADTWRTARAAHHRGPVARRRAPAERERLLAAALQCVRGARAVDERALA